MRPRTWLYVPGHQERHLAGAFDRGADAVVLDLEDAVPPDDKQRARNMVATVIRARPAWVRVNRAGSDACAADLEAVAEHAVGIRLAKVESADDVAWVLERAPGAPVDCLIETARGVLSAPDIARAAGVTGLAFGAADLAADLGVADAWRPLLHARSRVVLAAKAAGLPGPSDGVCTRLGDANRLRREASLARDLGFEGKSAIHPQQIPIVNEVFKTADWQITWAREVLAAFKASAGNPTQLTNGEFVDPPVAERARRLLLQAGADANLSS